MDSANKELKLMYGYWSDENDNHWSCGKYSYNEALEAAKTMMDCHNCCDSERCIECTNCYNCIDCNNCQRCLNVRYAVNCTSNGSDTGVGTLMSDADRVKLNNIEVGAEVNISAFKYMYNSFKRLFKGE